jgi:hypothetical protein
VARDDHGIFIDAGVTPYNNPALALLQLVAMPAQGFGWPLRAGQLRIVSVGTGAYRNQQSPDRLMSMTSGTLALNALLSSVRHGGQMIDDMLRLLGRDVRDGTAFLPDPLFEVLRLDVRLKREWLKRELGMTLSDRVLNRLRRMDDTTLPDVAWEIGARAGERILSDMAPGEVLPWA